MGPQPMPAAEVAVSPDLVRLLLATQQPDLAHLPVTMMTHGGDDVMCLVGDRLAARLPRREMAVTCLVNEQQWLPSLAPAKGWALAFSLIFLAHSADNPQLAGVGQQGLRAVLG